MDGKTMIEDEDILANIKINLLEVPVVSDRGNEARSRRSSFAQSSIAGTILGMGLRAFTRGRAKTNPFRVPKNLPKLKPDESITYGSPTLPTGRVIEFPGNGRIA